MITDMSQNYNSGGKRLLRPREGRILAGVAAGLAAYFGIDANLVRLGFGVFLFFWGLGALLYLIAWAIVPDEDDDISIVESFINRHRP